MKNKKSILGILVIFFGLMLFIPNNLSFGDDTGDPYSTKLSSSIGAWYDETWQAGSFYRLTPSAAPDNFYYSYTNDPTTASLPTFVTEGLVLDQTQNRTTDENLTPPSVHRHGYTDADTTAYSGASLPQDIVVIEWRVTGHVHSSSGM